MERPYESGMNDTAIFFTGIEVEKTPAHNMQTLFVVGMQSASTIVGKTLDSHYPCKHIYLGANHSFKNIDTDRIQALINVIDDLLAKAYYLTHSFTRYIGDIMSGEQYLNLIKKIFIFILAQIFMLLHIRLIKKELVLLQQLKVKIKKWNPGNKKEPLSIY